MRLCNWVDSIYLNKADSEAGSSQVPPIDKNNTQARKVLVLLGPIGDNSPLAIDFMAERPQGTFSVEQNERQPQVFYEKQVQHRTKLVCYASKATGKEFT
jgi:hypothetical protein